MTAEGKTRILLVDDNPVVRVKTAHLLRAAGCEVMEAATGEEGLAQMEGERPELVLLDVQLPGASGVEICRRIKTRPEFASVFVILLSSWETSAQRQAGGLEAGADGYIARPIENRELVARVHSMLRIQRAEAALRRSNEELECRVAERTSDLTAANAALKAMSLRLVEVQEVERRAVARELHDEIGQLLTSLKLLTQSGPTPAAERDRVRRQQADDVIEELLTRVRAMSLKLRPAVLDDLGLLPALDWLFQRWFRQAELRVRFRHSPVEGRLPSEIETAVFRVAQEALTNIARHAGAREADVRLFVSPERVVLQVEDRGHGFDLEQVAAAHVSSGLSGMRERALLLGGELTIESAPGEGTWLTLEVPRDILSPSRAS